MTRTPIDDDAQRLRDQRGRRITQLRKERRWSGRALAREIGLTQSGLWRVEHGLNGLSDVNLAKIAEVLEVPVTALYEPVEEAS